MKFENIRNEILVLFFLLFIIFDDHTFAAETDFKSTSEKINYQSYSAGQWKNGQQIYQAFCIHCHQTGIGPVIIGRHYSTVALSLFVRHGINTMPTFRTSEINDTELALLAKWVETSSVAMNDSTVGKQGGNK